MRGRTEDSLATRAHRVVPVRSGVPVVDGGRGEDCEDSGQVQDARHPVLGRDEPRGALPRGESQLSGLFVRFLTVYVQPSVGGISIDMSRMDKIIEINGQPHSHVVSYGRG